jgi:hypothetical protein
MEPSYQWLTFGDRRPSSWHIIDIMGAPIEEKETFKDKINHIVDDKSTLCISGELKKEGEGQPASNFRFNKDKETNETVIDNYLYLFHRYKEMTSGRPIMVTTIPRSWRKYSYFITEDGLIVRKDEDYRRKGDKGGQYHYSGHPGGCPEAFDAPDTKLMEFLEKRGVSQDKIIKIRESCKGAKYNTYLIDMISFLYQLYIGRTEFHTLFEVNYLRPQARKNDPYACASKNIKHSGCEWYPKDGQSYLYFEEITDNTGHIFFTPKKESVNQIYRDLDSALEPGDNLLKQGIRNHLGGYALGNLTFRWTDFDVNDTDDAFTILMMIHAFSSVDEEGNPVPITEREKKIKDELETIMKPWFSQLH